MPGNFFQNFSENRFSDVSYIETFQDFRVEEAERLEAPINRKREKYNEKGSIGYYYGRALNDGNCPGFC